LPLTCRSASPTDAAGNQRHRCRIEEVVGSRTARRRPVEKILGIAMPTKQRLAFRHAGRIDGAFDFLRQGHGLIAVQPAEGDFRMRFEHAAA
jgi:hypothetical protein